MTKMTISAAIAVIGILSVSSAFADSRNDIGNTDRLFAAGSPSAAAPATQPSNARGMASAGAGGR